jgi:GNAT superfamily N-acetyltransferase
LHGLESGDVSENRLLDVLHDSARGRFAAVKDGLWILPAPPGPAMAILGLPGRHVVASSAPEDWVCAHLPPGDLMAPLSPQFIAQLSARIGRTDDGIDVLLAARALDGTPGLAEVDPTEHPRALRALAHRDEVRTFSDVDQEATILLGRGLAGRLEVAVEVSPGARNRGVARRALHHARQLLNPGDVLFAQTAAANAASLRALLAAGYAPIGAEVLFFEGPRATD